MILFTAEFLLVALVIFYIAYLKTTVKLLRADVKKLKEEKDSLDRWIRPK